MKIFEVLDSEFKITNWDASPSGDEVYSTAEDNQGRTLAINFTPLETEIPNLSVVEIAFTREGSYELTNQGDALKVFGTVLGAVKRYLSKYRPDYFLFSAKEKSRFDLYSALIRRYAGTMGYTIIDASDLPSGVEDMIFIDSGTMILKKVK